MSAPEDRAKRAWEREDREYFLLITAHAHRELTTEENRRLLDLAERDPKRQSEVATMETLHDLLASERASRQAVEGALRPEEAGDESYRRLVATAADAEVQLRARLLHGQGVMIGAKRSRHAWPFAAAALLVAALCFWALSESGVKAGLLAGDPDDMRLGGVPERILLSAELSRGHPVFSWNRANRASRYDAFIEDRDGVVLMHRSSALAGLNRWNLSSQEFDRLAGQMSAHRDLGGLFLRIVGRDGAQLVVATSGSLRVVLVK